MIGAIISEAPTPLATSMDITPSGLLPRALQAQLSQPPALAGAVPPAWPVAALEALVVAARPAATPSGGWSLEIDIGGERVQMSSATLLAEGTRVLLRALSPQRVRVERLLGGPQALQPLRDALRNDLPAQVPLREAIARMATLATDPALPGPLRARIGEILGHLPEPAQLQQAAGLRAAVLNSGSFLEPRLQALLMAAAAAPPPRAAVPASAAAAPPPATGAGAAPIAPAPAVPASAPAPGPRAALTALLRLLLPATATPLYDARGALRRGPDSAPGIAPGTVPFVPAQAAPAPGPAASPQAAPATGVAASSAATPPASVAGSPAATLPASVAAAPPGGVAALPPVTPGPSFAPTTRTTDGTAPGRPPAPLTAGALAGAPHTAPAAAPAAGTVTPATPALAPGTAAPAMAPPLAAGPGTTASQPVTPLSGAGGHDPAVPQQPAALPGTGTLSTAGAGAPARPAATAGLGSDLKGQLFVLLEAVSAWLRQRPDAGRAWMPGAVPSPGLPLYTARGLFAGEATAAETTAVAQPAAEQLLLRLAQQMAGPENARPRDPADAVEALLRYVVGALARTRVHQLGVHPDSRRQGDSGALQAWSVEVPVACGGRFDVLEMRVEDHGTREESRGGTGRVWQVLMSLEIGEIGPLHALLRLSGARLATTLWVENPAALATARDTLAELGDCLRAEGVDVTRLECLPGAPPPRARSHDKLLDVST